MNIMSLSLHKTVKVNRDVSTPCDLPSNIEIGLVLSPLFYLFVTTRSADINLKIKFKNVF